MISRYTSECNYGIIVLAKIALSFAMIYYLYNYSLICTQMCVIIDILCKRSSVIVLILTAEKVFPIILIIIFMISMNLNKTSLAAAN